MKTEQQEATDLSAYQWWTQLSKDQLASTSSWLVHCFSFYFSDPTVMKAGALKREDLMSAAKFVWSEMSENDIELPTSSLLWREVEKGERSPVEEALELSLDEITRDDVYSYFCTEHWEFDDDKGSNVEADQND